MGYGPALGGVTTLTFTQMSKRIKVPGRNLRLSSSKSSIKVSRRQSTIEQLTEIDIAIPIASKRDQSPIQAKTPNQRKYIEAIQNSPLTFSTGPSGVGKTFIAAALAAQYLEEKKVQKIILTRPAVEAGESLGFLPGELEEKFDPYLWPFRDVLEQRLGKTYFEYLLKSGAIETRPLAYMRGMTLKDAFVILDEAQNASPVQMQMFLTRIGKNSVVVVNGDLKQKDISGTSGLEDALRKVMCIPEVSWVEFGTEDIVRSDLVGKIVKAYNR